MHLLPCPQCQSSIPVAPSQAGDQTNCPNCQAVVAIPTLGKLKQLPQEGSSDQGTSVDRLADPDGSPARRAGFVVLGVIATASLLIAGFAAVRWSLIETPTTTDEHLEEIRQHYDEVPAARLIQEFEQMEENALDLPTPYNYYELAQTKRSWATNALVAAAIAGFAIIGAALLASGGRRSARHPEQSVAADT